MIRNRARRFQSFWSLVRGKPENRRTVQLENRRTGWMMTIGLMIILSSVRGLPSSVFGPWSSLPAARLNSSGCAVLADDDRGVVMPPLQGLTQALVTEVGRCPTLGYGAPSGLLPMHRLVEWMNLAWAILKLMWVRCFEILPSRNHDTGGMVFRPRSSVHPARRRRGSSLPAARLGPSVRLWCFPSK